MRDAVRNIRKAVRVGVPLRVIHVVRNPFDNIATIALRAAGDGPIDLEAAMHHYFLLCETVERLEGQLENGELWRMTHEEFVADPQLHLRELCRWLGLDATDEYLEACGSITRRTPHRSRHKVDWRGEDRLEVERRSRGFSFLEGYAFEE